MFQLVKIKSCLDGLALELLRGRFPNVDVEPYYKMAEAYINNATRHNKVYRLNMGGNRPIETLFLLAMDALALAYVLLSGKRDEEKVGRLLKDFETMVGDYLEGAGLLTH